MSEKSTTNKRKAHACVAYLPIHTNTRVFDIQININLKKRTTTYTNRCGKH